MLVSQLVYDILDEFMLARVELCTHRNQMNWDVQALLNLADCVDNPGLSAEPLEPVDDKRFLRLRLNGHSQDTG